MEFFKRRGHARNLKKSLLQFQAFIKQARTFYDAAEALHYRASALNYYYSFLNLAKAYITIFDPLYVAGRVYHGLTHKRQNTPLSLQYIVCRNGVFPRFYRLITDQKMHLPTSIKISEKKTSRLFSMSSETSSGQQHSSRFSCFSSREKSSVDSSF